MKLLECTKLWQLLEIAIRDLKIAEQTPNTIINMDIWLSSNTGVCFCCMAGAVLKQEGYIRCDRADPETWKRMQVIEYLRTGHINNAYTRFYNHTHDDLGDRWTALYKVDRLAFFRDMEDMLKYLMEKDV